MEKEKSLSKPKEQIHQSVKMVEKEQPSVLGGSTCKHCQEAFGNNESKLKLEFNDKTFQQPKDHIADVSKMVKPKEQEAKLDEETQRELDEFFGNAIVNKCSDCVALTEQFIARKKAEWRKEFISKVKNNCFDTEFENLFDEICERIEEAENGIKKK